MRRQTPFLRRSDLEHQEPDRTARFQIHRSGQWRDSGILHPGLFSFWESLGLLLPRGQSSILPEGPSRGLSALPRPPGGSTLVWAVGDFQGACYAGYQGGFL